ncbi:glycoside hydrolase [Schizophyllum commune]
MGRVSGSTRATGWDAKSGATLAKACEKSSEGSARGIALGGCEIGVGYAGGAVGKGEPCSERPKNGLFIVTKGESYKIPRKSSSPPHPAIFDHPPPPPPPPFIPLHEPVRPPPTPEEAKTWAARADLVRNAFVHAYNGYRRQAFGHDEVRPVSGRTADTFNAWGVSAVDGLDTMWLMGLEDMFEEAVDFISQQTWAMGEKQSAPFFETTIRYLGGLLSAYAMSKHPTLLAKADALGSALLKATNTTSGLPAYGVNTVSGELHRGFAGSSVLLAEALSCQVEFKYLAHLTGKREYYEKVEHINDVLLYNSTYADGLYPSAFDLGTGAGKNFHFSAGAAADSAYEYLLKQWLVSGRSETRVRDHYIHSANAILANLAYVSPTRGLLYVTDAVRKPYVTDAVRKPAGEDVKGGKSLPNADMQTARGRPSHNFEHLTCFLGGLLALGARTVPDLDGREATRIVDGTRPLTVRDRRRLYSHPKLHPLLPQRPAPHLLRARPAAPHVGRGGPDGDVLGDVRGYAERVGVGTGGGPPTPWLDAVDKWERAGRPGGDKPPGARRVEPIPADVKNRAQALDYRVRSNSWLLRPETIESIYLLWRTTGDPVWRERGWRLFESMERWCRAEYGYSVVNQINTDHPRMTDEQPSWLFAETFKYLFLLFTDEDLLPLPFDGDPNPLDKWVFNTEAHPLPVFEWRAWEREAYGIA